MLSSTFRRRSSRCLHVINEPETTESLLLDAGFVVIPSGQTFRVCLATRRVTRGEVAEILGCESQLG